MIGLQSCQHGGCHDPADGLGTVLYNGGFDPQYGPPRVWWKPPHQNFTVTIPSDAPKGKAVLGLVHVALIGVSSKIFTKLLVGWAYDFLVPTFIMDVGWRSAIPRDSQCYVEDCLKAGHCNGPFRRLA